MTQTPRLNNGWGEYQKLVLSELERLNKDGDQRDKHLIEIDKILAKLEQNISNFKTAVLVTNGLVMFAGIVINIFINVSR